MRKINPRQQLPGIFWSADAARCLQTAAYYSADESDTADSRIGICDRQPECEVECWKSWMPKCSFFCTFYSHDPLAK